MISNVNSHTTPAIAIYSLPDKKEFYQVRGPLEIISTIDVFRKPGFIFAPFDSSTEVIYRIAGHPQKCLLDPNKSRNWIKNTRISASTDFDTYQSMFYEGLEAIQAGKLDKIVLSIQETVHTVIPSIPTFLLRIREAYPNAFIYLFYIPEKEFWIGASPELLLDTNYPFQRTMALAGTRTGAPQMDQWPNKEQKEHRYVERYIEDVLIGKDYHKEGPSPVAAGPVYHLKSTYFINIHESAMNPFDLHPGPALSGYPVQASINKIKQIESNPRRYYTGFLGPVWEERQNQFFVNLRCLELLMDQQILYAGSGLTGDSDLHTEWNEIQDKLSTLRSKF